MFSPNKYKTLLQTMEIIFNFVLKADAVSQSHLNYLDMKKFYATNLIISILLLIFVIVLQMNDHRTYGFERLLAMYYLVSSLLITPYLLFLKNLPQKDILKLKKIYFILLSLFPASILGLCIHVHADDKWWLYSGLAIAYCLILFFYIRKICRLQNLLERP